MIAAPFGANLLALTLSKPSKTSAFLCGADRKPAIKRPPSLTNPEALDLENHSKWRLH